MHNSLSLVLSFGYGDSVKAYRLMDPETHQIFVDKDVHFEESSPNLSSNPLHTSYHVENDSDTSDSASTNLDMWGSVDSCSEQSLYQYSPHAYIATVIDPEQQGTSSLPGPASNLGTILMICLFLTQQLLLQLS